MPTESKPLTRGFEGLRSTGERLRAGGFRRPLIAWLPVAVGVVYVLRFLVQAHRIVGNFYANADIASGPVLAHLLPVAPSGAHVVLGNYPWYEALGLQLALDQLPGSRAVLEVAPFVFAIATAALVAWSVSVSMRSIWPSGVAAVIVLASGAAVWPELGTWTVHGLTWLHVASLGALLVWLTREPRRGLGVAVAVAVVWARGSGQRRIGCW